MKKLLSVVLCLLMIAALLPSVAFAEEDRYLEINETNFPDDNFQQWVIENLPVSGNEIDGYYMTEAQVAGVTEIECGNGEVASLCGIEHFTNLEALYCDPFTFSMSGALTGVDLSANTKLKVVDLSCHPLSAIDVTMLPDLEELAVGFTNVSTLDVTKNTKLARLTINATGLSTIDLSQNPLLDWLDLCDAPIQKLDISGCPNMMAYYRAGERHLDLPYLEGRHVYGEGNDDIQYNLAFSDGTTVQTVALTAYARCGETEIGSVAVSPEGIIFPGEQFTLTAPEVEGYVFLGWYRNGSEQMLSDELVYTTSTREEEISFVAAYQENTTDGGPCGEQGGDNVYWVYDKTTYTLTIAGNGKVEANSAEPPWYNYIYDIRKIVVEDGVTSVPGGLFCDARELTSVELGKDVSELKWNPFAWCGKLASIVVDPGNETFRTVDGVLITADGKRIVAYPAQREGSSYAIPDGVTEIGANAFCTAKKLTSVTIPDSVTAIDGYAFAQSGLTSVTVPASVENVWGGAFEACAALETVVIEGSTTGFGYNDGAEEEGAFIDCSNLRSLTIPCDQHPYERTFAGCYSLEELHLTAGSGEINVSMIGDLLFWYRYTEYCYWDEEAQDWVDGTPPDPKPMSLILDEGITVIPAGAFDCNYEEEDDFEGNSAIASVTLPVSVIEIGENAFIHCGNLTDVWYNGTPSQKEQIAVAAGNEDLLNAEWHFTDAYSGQCGDDLYWSFDKETGTLTITGSGDMWDNECGAMPWEDVTVEYVDSYGGAVLRDDPTVSLIHYIILPEGLMSIASGAFCGTLIESIEIPSTVKSILYMAFASCENLKSIAIPDGISKITWQCFSNCGQLESVTLPVSVTEVYEGAFWDCNAITDVYYQGTAEQRAEMTFGDDNEPLLNATWHYESDGPSEPVTGQCGENLFWSFDESTGTLTITGSGDMWDYTYDGNEQPEYGLFCPPWQSFREQIISIDLPDGLLNIGSAAFMNCTGLKSISIPDGVITINKDAFYECTGIVSITIPNSVDRLENRSFFCCTGLKDVAIGKNVSYIGNNTFTHCLGLNSIVIPDSVTVIDNFAFCDCEGLETITIGSGVENIGSEAFFRCSALTDVWYNGTKTDRDQKLMIGSDNDPLINATWHYCAEAIEGVVEWNAEDVAFKDGTAYVIADGTAKTPRFTVKDEDGNVVDPANYDCEYKDNIEPGTASVIVTFKGEYSGTCSGTFEICSPTEIKTQPKAQTVANGKTAKFTVAALGKGVKYQWYYSTNNGAKWTKWSGKTSASVSVAASAKTNGNLYRCEITKDDYSSTSKSAKLTVSGVKPRITAQPKKTTVAVGETATFKVVAAGTGLKYQWYYSKDNGAKWVKWSGKTKASVKVTTSAANNGTMYRCVVKNTKGSVTSSAVKMTVSGVKPRILTQPKAVTAAAGKTVKFTVAAAGVGLKYQWQYSKNGGKTWTKLSGKTSATLSFKAAKKNNGWLYRCVVKNDIGSVNSKGVKLTVK